MKFVFGLIAAMIFSFSSAQAQTMVGGKEFVKEYVYDFAVDGGATGFIDLSAKGQGNTIPSGARIMTVHSDVLTALTSGGSATVAIGDAGSGARYLSATAFNNAAYTGFKALSTGLPHAVASANAGKFGITIATAALTAGKIRFIVRGYIPRSQ